MQRCLELAKKGIGTTRPNPAVGAVLVANNVIIGEGYTSPYGGSHAEVNAIASVNNKGLLKQATLYVTLEPCSHYGKTPPCSDLILEKQIPKVVIGCVDDNPLVGGKGIKRLQTGKVDVTLGVLENECREHHKRFFTYHNKKRPYIVLKWAETSNGFITPKAREKQAPVWISNPKSRQLTHQWRAEEQAILVGARTVLQDNPSLTVREAIGENPIRIVVSNGKILPKDLSVFNKEAPTQVISESNPYKIVSELYQQNIQSVLIEGGLKTLQSFIDANLWDEARVFKGKINFDDGIKAPNFTGKLVQEETILDDILQIYTHD